MARHESDREDLFDELAALSPRLELRPGDDGETVCAGRRESTGGWSFFFGAERVYHFDAAGRLRRAYVQGFLYRSEGSTLSRLRRKRSATETTLLRNDLDAGELSAFVEEMRIALHGILSAMTKGEVQVLRSLPAADHQGQLQAALALTLSVAPALAPAIRG